MKCRYVNLVKLIFEGNYPGIYKSIPGFNDPFSKHSEINPVERGTKVKYYLASKGIDITTIDLQIG